MRTIEEEQKDVLVQIQLDNLKKMLGADIKHKIHVDHTGRAWKTIEISYEQTEPL